MIVELRKWHWTLFSALVATQSFGLWMTLSRSSDGPAVANFFMHTWVGLANLALWVLGSAFLTTVVIAQVIAQLIQSRVKRK